MRAVPEETLQERWIKEAAESDLGLWWLADDVREILGPESSEVAVRSRTLELLEPLLRSGQLRPVDLLPEGRFREWRGGVAQQLARISQEWEQLSRRPRIGDVVTFIGPR